MGEIGKLYTYQHIEFHIHIYCSIRNTQLFLNSNITLP